MQKHHADVPAPYHANNLFRKIASHTSHGVGSPWAFVAALGVVVAWGLTGPLFHYSDTWQLVINTGTTIVTFLMVFLIQNTQNRDSHALHLKLAELIRANDFARNRLMCLEELTDFELDELQHEFDELAERKIASRSQRQATKARGATPVHGDASAEHRENAVHRSRHRRKARASSVGKGSRSS